MKRLFVSVIAVIAFGSVALAKNNTIVNNEYVVFSKLSENSKFEGLVKYLGADMDQRDYLEEIFLLSMQKMERKSFGGTTISKDDMERIVAFNLANAKNVLSQEQYKKYLIVLNLTLNNVARTNRVLAQK